MANTIMSFVVPAIGIVMALVAYDVWPFSADTDWSIKPGGNNAERKRLVGVLGFGCAIWIIVHIVLLITA